MSYQEKYLKYKKKYLNLQQNQYGGIDPIRRTNILRTCFSCNNQATGFQFVDIYNNLIYMTCDNIECQGRVNTEWNQYEQAHRCNRINHLINESITIRHSGAEETDWRIASTIPKIEEGRVMIVCIRPIRGFIKWVYLDDLLAWNPRPEVR